jgi:thiamine biosynthesis lipoprotein ApbE
VGRHRAPEEAIVPVRRDRDPVRRPGHLQYGRTTLAPRRRRPAPILDPRSGRPAAPVWRTVSVAAETGTDANMASTAAIIRREGALAWLAELGFPARLVAESGAVVTLGGWPPDQPSAT